MAWKKVGSGAATLYSLHTNHLGSVAHVGDANGARIDSGYAMYEPFGAFSHAPTGTNPSVTDRGFTGHRQNNTGAYDLKLIYMNARYYHPQLGRFISPDTIVPDPGNPQSYNRYAYVRNNPVNFTDPTGHREKGADERDVLPNQPPPSIEKQLEQGTNAYGIDFQSDSGQSWTTDQMRVVLRGVAAVDRALRLAGGHSGYLPGSAFRKLIGPLTMFRSATERDYGAETFYDHGTIEFYAKAFSPNPLDPKFRNNVVHELGHAFNAAIVTASNGRVNPYDDLETALGEDGTLGIFRAREGLDTYPWQQASLNADTKNEIFADYFLSWTYGNFLANDAGQAQSSWMSEQMSSWVSR